MGSIGTPAASLCHEHPDHCGRTTSAETDGRRCFDVRGVLVVEMFQVAASVAANANWAGTLAVSEMIIRKFQKKDFCPESPSRSEGVEASYRSRRRW